MKKALKSMRRAGGWCVVMGVVTLVTGVTVGTGCLVAGGSLLKNSHLLKSPK